MSQVKEFLESLYGAYEGDIPLDVAGGEDITLTPPQNVVEFFKANPDCRVYPTDGSTTAFIFTFTETQDPETYRECLLKPTVVLHDGEVMLFFWAFGTPVPDGNPTLQALWQAFKAEGSESLPVPGGKWKLIHNDLDIFYTVEQMSCYLEEQETTEEKKYGDADIITPYNELDYEFPIRVSLGAKTNAISWPTKDVPLAGVIGILTQHKEGPKDGHAIVFADLVSGQRTRNAVKSVSAIGLDIDTGTPIAHIDDALRNLGCLAVRYTTHSHNKTETEFKMDEVVKFTGSKEAITTETMRDYLRGVKEWEAGIVDTVEVVEVGRHEKEGLQVVCRHAPMPKNRVIVFLKEPYDIAAQIGVTAKTQMEAVRNYALLPAALADHLQVPMDRACTDPCRLFYTPRHAKGRAFSTSLFGGQLFDHTKLKPLMPEALDKLAKEMKVNAGKSKTERGKSLGKWMKKTGHGFQITDLLQDQCPDRLRGRATMGFNIECPFDEGHSNAGNPEDRACYAVNAAEGGNELFIVSCRHGSCRDYTMLDMVGKMLDDSWYPEELLNDPNYNAAVDEDAPAPESQETPEPKKEKAQNAKDSDVPRAPYDDLIETLNVASTPETRERVCREIVKLNLDTVARANVLIKIQKQCKSSAAAVRGMFQTIEKKVKEEGGKADASRDDKNRTIFRYESPTYNFHEATEVCTKALQADNEKKLESGFKEFYPKWTYMDKTPVQLVMDRATNRLKFKEHNESSLWSEQCEKVVFTMKNDNGDGPLEQVPETVAKHVFFQFYQNFSESPEIVYTPLFVQGGTLLDKPGYYGANIHPDLNLLVADNCLDIGEKIDRNPTDDQAAAALEWLREEILSDFPFLDKNEEGTERREPSEANALAMLLTPFMRRMINSCTPVFFITKPQAGTGGTLLGKIPMMLFDGFVDAPARYSQNEEEMNKSLIAEILKAHSHLFFDDVGDFNNRELLRAITSTHIGGRILGGSTTISRKNNFIWIATGNNPSILNEMERRIVWIRLNAKTSDIQKRKFKHNLELFLLGQESPQVIEGQRAKAVRAILTLIQYWISKGMPLFTARTRISFEDWAAKVGGVLEAVGVEGFLDNKRDVGQDMDEAATKQLVVRWIENYGAEHLVLPTDLFHFAENQALEIIQGANDDQKKFKFMRKLSLIEGRSFNVNNSDWMVCSGIDREQNVAYYVTQVRKPEE